MPPSRVYRVRRGWRIFFVGLGGFLGVFSLCGLVYFGIIEDGQTPTQTTIMIGINGAFSLLGLVIAGYGFRMRLEMSNGVLRYRELFRTKETPIHEITSYRFVHQTSPGLIVFDLKESARQLKVANVFDLDDAFYEWMDQLRDLEQEEVETELEQVVSDTSIGETSDDRLDLLDRARRESKWINGIAFAVGIWAFLYPRPYAPLMLALIAAPMLSVGYLWWRQGLVTFDGTAQQLRPTVALPVLLSSLVLALRSLLDFNMAIPASEAAGPCLAAGFAFWLLLLWADPATRQKKPAAALMLVLALVFGYGSVMMSNSLFDTREPQRMEAAVRSKHVTTGKVQRYIFDLEELGTVQVSHHVYERIAVGELACVQRYDGALGIGWMAVDPCPAR